MLALIIGARARSQELHDALSKRKDDLKGVEIGKKPESWAFQVCFGSSEWGLSISTNPDVIRYKALAETALVKKTDGKWGLAYDKDAGYQDVNMFDTLDELVAEIQRVRKWVDDKAVKS